MWLRSCYLYLYHKLNFLWTSWIHSLIRPSLGWRTRTVYTTFETETIFLSSQLDVSLARKGNEYNSSSTPQTEAKSYMIANEDYAGMRCQAT